MCSISVEPIPSMISTPKRAVQFLPISSGSGSPADVHSRSASSSRAGRSGCTSSAPNSVGTPQKIVARCVRRIVLDRVGRRARRVQHRRRADRHRKRQRVAQPVREEQFRRGVHDVVLAHPEHVLREQLRGANQAGLHVHGALRLAGRARRVQPEAHVVGPRRRGVGERRRARGQRRERRMRAGVRAARIGHDEAARSSSRAARLLRTAAAARRRRSPLSRGCRRG